MHIETMLVTVSATRLGTSTMRWSLATPLPVNTGVGRDVPLAWQTLAETELSVGGVEPAA